ncbi:MAG: helix-turn-helix domain-containing protein [Alphaproteobacteria bacterium]|nr:helix-turn-helix domain-containing protein [Alphaproteobacteria bacterium]
MSDQHDDNIEIEPSSGNVFADLGVPNSDRELLKAQLTVEVYKIIKERGLTQSEAATLLGTTQPQISALMRCQPVNVSVSRLMEFLAALGRDVEISVRSKPSKPKESVQGRVMLVPAE